MIPTAYSNASRPLNNPQQGFTLVELVLAIAILGSSVLTMQILQLEAVSRAGNFNKQRTVQRYAQEKLDEVVFGIEQDTEGAIERIPNWNWTVEVINTSSEGPELLEVTLTLRYPGESIDQEDSYVLSTWILPEADHPLLGMNSGGNTR